MKTDQEIATLAKALCDAQRERVWLCADRDRQLIGNIDARFRERTLREYGPRFLEINKRREKLEQQLLAATSTESAGSTHSAFHEKKQTVGQASRVFHGPTF